MSTDVDAFLAHHGIKGQKWGIRNDRKSSGGSNPKGSAGGDEEALAYTVSLGAMLALYGGVALAKAKDAGRFHSLVEKGDWKKNPNLAKKMSSDAIMSNVVKQINPGYGQKGTKMNCRRCTFAYEMRRRGYNVKATHSNWATGQDYKGLSKAVSKTQHTFQGETMLGKHLIYHGMPRDPKQSTEIFKRLAKEGNGARGELGVEFAYGGAHSMAWENVNHKPVIFDTQNGKKFTTSKDLGEYLGNLHTARSSYTRLDNANLNNQFLKRWLADA